MQQPLEPMLAQANAQYAARQWPEAEATCRQLLARWPDHADATVLLGLLAAQAGRFGEAAALIGQAIRTNPNVPGYHNDLGKLIVRLGQAVEAEAAFRKAVELDPNFAEAHNNWANMLHTRGRLDDAIAEFRRAIELSPAYPEAHYNLGNALRDRGQLDDAVASYRQAIHLRPDLIAAHNNLAQVLHKLGRLQDAAAAFTALGGLLQEMGNPEEAETRFRQAARLNPDHHAYTNIGAALARQGKYPEARASFQQALALAPDSIDSLIHLGNVRMFEAAFDEAEACLQRALHLDPKSAEAHYSLAQLRLLRGDFERGLPEYEWRWLIKEVRRAQRHFRQPQWDGADLAGRTILLRAEGGLGDTLQFIRYATFIKQQKNCGTVILDPPSTLVRLLARCPGIDRIIPRGSTLPDFDVHAPLMSLPLLFGTRPTTIPATPAYLSADPELVEHWRRELAPLSGFRIGIVWQGNTKFFHDRVRSFPLALFEPLARLPGVRFLSLQKVAGLEQIRECAARFPITDLSPQLDDFMDTAAAVQNLDLVITADTAVAHLAGAMGVPVWLALAKVPEWRWLMDREDSPWYPTMRLFRQSRHGDWQSVLSRMAGELAQKLQLPPPPPPSKGGEIILSPPLEGGAGGGEFSLNASTLASAPRDLQAIPPTKTPAEAHGARGIALWEAGRIAEAMAAFQAAIQAGPNDAGAHHNYAVALSDYNHFAEAEPHYRKAIEIQPDYADAHHGLAMVHLARGELREGWLEYEWRKKLPTSMRPFPDRQWAGQPIQGRTMVLLDEQGLGDAIQFVRYAALVAARGAKVIVVCNPPLARLMSMASGVNQVVPRGQPVRSYDFHWPLFSLPLMFNTQMDTIPATVPYLHVPAKEVERWRHKLGPAEGMRVGLVWAGNPGYRRDRERSIAPARLAPLAKVLDEAKVTFYSLQKGPTAPHAAGLPPVPLIDLSPDLLDLADTAAVIASLDLVITVDTAVAHLAGALRRPVWLLLAFAPSWRWLLDREDSPWYPSMRLFRQETPDSWEPVIQRVAQELAELARAQSPLADDDALPHFNRGNLLLQEKRLDEAIAAYRMAVRLRPDFASAHNNLGTALKESDRLGEAIASYLKALSLKPTSHVYHYNLGAALSQVGRLAEAEAEQRRAIELKPDFVLAHTSLGTVLKDLNRLDEAIAAYQQALSLEPDCQPAHYNLGNAMKDAGDVEQAVIHYRRALQLSPGDALCHSNLAYVVHFHPDYDGPAILAENRRWDEAHSPTVERHSGPWPNARDPDRRLRIGYVGADFRDHCQSLFMIPLLTNHKHDSFEIYCYANVPHPDDYTRRTQQLVDHWRSTFKQADAAVAAMVHRDQIDILADLTMHMGRGRPLLFARKPAPVQVAWLAYPGTTGQSAIDWRLTDPYLDPPGQNDSHYAEKSYRLADTFWCYDPLTADLPIRPLPAQQSGQVTFGCFNNFCKVTQPTVQLWSRVLSAVPDSRLILLAPPGRHRETLSNKFALLNIDPTRIGFVDLKPRAEYLQNYHLIDMCLDTIPYNGHTTSLDSFWMGVPVVTLVGTTAVGRAGLSQLANLGLTELAGHTPDDFVRIAVALATDLPRLAELRTSLRSRLKQSPLMDGARFADSMEAAFRAIWRQWCGSENLESQP